MPRLTSSQRFRAAAEEFARRVQDLLGDKLHAVVLYGSVARGEAKADSDVDVLVVPAEPGLEGVIGRLSSDLALLPGYHSFISLVYLTPQEMEHRLRVRSPFLLNVLEEGVILYDDGTFARICGQAVSAGR